MTYLLVSYNCVIYLSSVFSYLHPRHRSHDYCHFVLVLARLLLCNGVSKQLIPDQKYSHVGTTHAKTKIVN